MLSARQLRTAALLAALLVLSTGNSAPATFGALLQRADESRSADPQRFQQFLKQLNSRVGEASNEEHDRLRYLNAYAVAYSGDYAQAARELEVLFHQVGDPTLRFRVGALLANSMATTRQFSEGLLFLDRMLELLPEVGDQEIRHQGLGVAALLYNQVGQFELGRQYAQLVLRNSPNPRMRCYANQLLMESLYGLGQLPNDDREFRGAVDQCLNENEAIGAGLVRSYMARVLFKRGQISEAIDLLQSELRAVEDTRYPRLLAEVHSLLGELELAGGRLETAESHSMKAIEQSGAQEYSLPVVVAHKTLSEIARQRGDDRAALAHFRKYAEADKAYLNETMARQIAFQLARQESLQKSRTIELLNKQNEVLQLEQQVAEQTAKYNRAMLALLIVLLASIGFWAYRLQRTQRSFRRLAETDALTGVASRHHFMQRAGSALSRAAQEHGRIALVILDLDHFKAINDGFGHPVGDWVLQQAAEACRGAHLLGRLGGEEFVLLLPGHDAGQAQQVAEQCRRAIARIDTGAHGGRFAVTASFGVACTTSAGYDLARLITQADQALYAAKRSGRDRVCRYVADPELASVD